MKVPTIGESVTEVTLSQWLKADGDYVELDEPICEFESDKATLEFPAEAAGILKHIAAEDDDLEIGALVATIDTSAAKNASTDKKETATETEVEQVKEETSKESTSNETSSPSAEPVEMRVPTIGESVTEVTLSQWLKEDGDYVELDEAICEFESDKATLEFPAEVAGILSHVAEEGEDLEIGALVAKITPSEGGGTSSPKAETTTAASTSSNASYATGHPSPAAAKTIRENNVDASTVKGTGKDGRITQADAQKAANSKSTTKTPAVAAPEKVPAKEATKVAASASSASYSRNTRRQKMSRMRRAIAKNLVNTKNNTAMLTTFNEVDMTAIFALRKKYQDRFVEKYGTKLGFMSLFSKACAKVLMEMPDVNAQLDDKELIYHDFVDISIAISTPNGLVVPPVRNVESMNFAEIELAIKDLAVKARNGKLSIDEMTGGTFSITNGGIFGSMMSTPIINGSQSAILGMHNIIQRPIAVDGEVQVRPMMYLALSYDHRVIDGSTSVTFLVKVKNLLEDPVSLLLDL